MRVISKTSRDVTALLLLIRGGYVDGDLFGAHVTICNEAGDQSELRIVGADEIDPPRNWISVDSPMARALLKRRVDEEFLLRTPAGEVSYCLLEVRYESDGQDQ